MDQNELPRTTLFASLLVFASCAVFAQTAPAPPRIEVATVRPDRSGVQAASNHFDPERMTWTGVFVKMLIENAYGVQDYQVLGGPSWLSSDRWTIEAKTEGPTTFTQKMQLLQPLLEDRFQLKLHRETRKLPEYRLVVAKSGPKLRQVRDGDAGSVRVGRGRIEGHQIPIARLAFFLQAELGRPVLEATGLKGNYDFKLEWVPDESQPNSGGEAPPPDAAGPSIFAAIQEQLGLKLQAIKGPVEVLVIDHVEKPSEN